MEDQGDMIELMNLEIIFNNINMDEIEYLLNLLNSEKKEGNKMCSIIPKLSQINYVHNEEDGLSDNYSYNTVILPQLKTNVTKVKSSKIEKTKNNKIPSLNISNRPIKLVNKIIINKK